MYRIEISQKPPSMSTSKVYVEGTFAQAIAAAHGLRNALDYPASVYIYGETATYWWYQIARDGETMDRSMAAGRSAQSNK